MHRRRAPAVAYPPHPCPGGCGAEVPHHLVACPPCWWLLPRSMRKRIANGKRRERLATVAEALEWYRDNVRDGAPL